MRWVLAASSLAVLLGLLSAGDVLADPAPGSLGDTSAVVTQVLVLTNAERSKAGVAPLALNFELSLAAQGYSQVLASSDCFAHTCGPVPDFAARDEAAGYLEWTTLGENLAGGYATPESVVAGWMASPPHRANMLSVNFTDIGIGVTSSSGRFSLCWAAEFGAREDSAAAGDD